MTDENSTQTDGTNQANQYIVYRDVKPKVKSLDIDQEHFDDSVMQDTVRRALGLPIDIEITAELVEDDPQPPQSQSEE